MQDKRILIEKIREWDNSFQGKKTRDAFLKSTYGSYFNRRSDIDSNGGWGSLYHLATGKKAAKIGNKSATTEELFSEYARLQQIYQIFDRPLSVLEINSQDPKFSGSVFKKKFPGGLRKFYIEHKKWNDKALSFFPPRIYIGKATEYLALAELLFRQYNAQLISVDEGLDIIAYKHSKHYLFQVKHAEYQKELRLENINLTKSSFEREKSTNIFYIFVLSRNGSRDFLVIPVFDLEKLIDTQGDKIICKILHKDKDTYLNRVDKEHNVTKYLNLSGWKILEHS